jgi:type IV pilus assembly protein PilW
MIGLVVGTVAVIMMMSTLGLYEAQKRGTTGGSDAQITGSVGMFRIEREVRMAGFGLTSATGVLCPQGINIYYGGAVVSAAAPLPPVIITDGDAGPDRIRVTRSNSQWGIAPITVIKDALTAASALTVNMGGALQTGDLFIVGAADGSKVCTLMQMSDVVQTAAQGWDLKHEAVSFPYNPPDVDQTFNLPAKYYATGDVITSLGNFGLSTFAVVCSDGNAPSATNNCALGQYDTLATPAPALNNVNRIASQIVELQAQYGVAPAGSQTVSEWVDATGTWAAPSAADLRRIKAIRVAIVARSTKYEGTEVSPEALVLWDEGLKTERTRGLTADERHFRYKVFSLVIPVVNMIWANV